MGMYGANQTRIVGTANMPNFDRIMRVSDGRPDQRFLHWAADAVTRPGSDIPGRRRDDLVVLDLAALYLDPMA
jgi:hypothetical protein